MNSTTNNNISGYELIQLKYKAWRAVTYAIKAGKIIRQPCEICGKNESHAHHHKGYDEQNKLNVRWLCSTHHHEQHPEVIENSKKWHVNRKIEALCKQGHYGFEITPQVYKNPTAGNYQYVYKVIRELKGSRKETI